MLHLIGPHHHATKVSYKLHISCKKKYSDLAHINKCQRKYIFLAKFCRFPNSLQEESDIIGQTYDLEEKKKIKKKKREKRPLPYQLGQLLLFLHIFAKDHENGAPQHLTAARKPMYKHIRHTS
jgi:hypothetical protein